METEWYIKFQIGSWITYDVPNMSVSPCLLNELNLNQRLFKMFDLPLSFVYVYSQAMFLRLIFFFVYNFTP
jgi:hypothetical protein